MNRLRVWLTNWSRRARGFGLSGGRAGKAVKGFLKRLLGSLGEAAAETPGGILYVDAWDSLGLLRPGSVYEEPLVRFFSDFVRPREAFFDVGANIGYFTLLAAKLVGPSGRVFAFEPNLEAADLLERSARANGYFSVEVVRKAVGRESCPRASFFLSDATSSFHNRHGGTPADVEVVSLDEYMAQSGVEPDWLKIDAEGSEADILAGMRGYLSRRADVRLVLEFAPRLLRLAGADPKRFLASLRERGFVVYSVGARFERCNLDAAESIEKYAKAADSVNLFCARGAFARTAWEKKIS